MELRKLLFCAIFLGFVFSGCSREPSPGDVVEQLFKYLKYADQEGWGEVRNEVFNLLSKDSRDMVTRRCEQLGDVRGSGQGLDPRECLVFTGFVGGRELTGVEDVAVRETRARLLVKTGGGSSVLDLVKEDGAWKLDLVSSIALAGAQANDG